MKKVIPFSYFVKIVSKGVAPAFTFNRLNALVITTPAEPHPLIEEFTNATDVGSAYGAVSPEYAYAQKFFGYMSKSATTPERLIFWNYSSTATTAALVGGHILALDDIKLSGGFALSVNGIASVEITVDLSSAISFTQAATLINAAFETATLAATCTYDVVKGGFVIKTTLEGNSAAITYATAPESGTDLSSALGLTAESGATLVAGQNAQTLQELLNEIALANGNYVSISTLNELTPATDFKIISEWTAASGGRYIFIAHDSQAGLKQSTPIIYENLFNNDGFVVNAMSDNSINALVQATIASVDYASTNGAMNFNFIPAASWADDAVGTESELNGVNAQRVNTAYTMGGYGQSQTLWGEGNIFGQTFKDITGFCGNSWLKAQFELAVANLLIATPLIALRGTIGNALVLTSLQSVIDKALQGGIITKVGINALTSVERAAVVTATADPASVQIIEEAGYYIRPEALTEEDLQLGRLRVLFLYTRNVPINRVAIQNYVLG